ncbi:PREDICTED: tRNA wybutosine-synthesizing protein 5 isoform X2 [Lupinus angustifolius]|uniref:tRNA wybutosine-synthesizing protein 5 isoform X2 n=1 Tax=Lupinus angustifolius TaxID=3871 RepID=UPI00092F517B|nr:PREDICTED: tRNA wybutosine-synthesizing protein 5 isoform X2 [Lupinus angustifolius]
MEESIRVRRYEQLPTAKDFESLIELQNVPAVFVRCTKDWRAFSKWNPSNAGLDYLQARVGSSAVEAMMSGSAPVFYGDLGSHERVPLPFSTFIDFCKQRMQSKHQESLGPSCLSPQTHDLSSSGIDGAYLSSECVPEQIYLAQVPIMNSDCEERVQLETLRKDIQIPSFLEEKELSSINLWMNNAQARSSTHYDPHHNILCIVCGRKQVVLWPPSSSPSLYPMPIYGEASNHSSVALENPDYSIYPRAEHSIDFAQKVILEAGDALFIPEGWFHQVDSDDLTIAINFWWRSNIMSSMLEHMDAYYLRRILRRLIDKEMHNFPRTLEAFVLHALSPVGAEVLTRKFDEMDQQSLEEDRIRFYEVFYSAFDDQSAAMNSILKGKESFTQQAFKSVLDKFVGVNLESSKLGVRRDA